MRRDSLSSGELERRAGILLHDYGGIVPQTEAFYLHSIIYSAGLTLRAFAEYDTTPHDQAHAEQLVTSVQEAVGHAAALSRYFWPSFIRRNSQSPLERVKNARGERLRAAFQLTDTSPLHDRALRNAWEHFDERLDSYLIENDSGLFFPTCILGDHQLADDQMGHPFKLIDPQAECLVLLGDKYFFAPIREEVIGVVSKALAAEHNGSRLPQSAAVSS